VSDLDAPTAGRGPGRPPKPDKRVLLSLRMEPELRARIVTMTEESGRSITQETEALLESALNGRDRDAPLGSVKPQGGTDQTRSPDEVEGSLLFKALELSFGRQLGGLLLMIGYAMFFARLESIAWSRDVAERTRRFPVVKPGAATTLRQLSEVAECLNRSSSSHAGEQSWLDDPYVVGQVAAAAREVLETIAPEGDPLAPPLPRGIEPALALTLMINSGKTNANETMRNLLDEEPDPGSFADRLGKGGVARVRHWLGEAVVARFRQKFCSGVLRVRPSRFWAPPSDMIEDQDADG